jgi:superoxide dismutase, Cu-Zn family
MLVSFLVLSVTDGVSSQFGNATDGCASSGLHFNPYNTNHGARTDEERHVGDLGNIESDAFGVARWQFEDEVISLNGPNSIVGLVIYFKTLE